METLTELLEKDLDQLTRSIAEELTAMEGSHLVVTGGGGFLGYYLVQTALYWNDTRGRAPIDVTVVENFRRGAPRWLVGLRDKAHLSLLEHDVTRPLPKGVPPFDYAFHAAGIASPTYYRRYPIETMDTNVAGLRLLLERARAQGDREGALKGLVFFSSSEIYGDPPPDCVPTPEDYRGNVSCTGPRACYDEAKRFGETLVVNFARQHGLKAMVARPFNNYGPGLKITDRRVIPDFARDILSGRDIVMLSDGAPRRTFCYATDAIAGYYKILVRGRAGEPYNIGVEAPEISMADLAERLAGYGRTLFGYRGQVVRRKSPEADYLADNPQRRCPVVKKARAELGYAPSMSLEEGLRRAMVWYGHNRDAEEA